jgi:hypothetical protein
MAHELGMAKLARFQDEDELLAGRAKGLPDSPRKEIVILKEKLFPLVVDSR